MPRVSSSGTFPAAPYDSHRRQGRNFDDKTPDRQSAHCRVATREHSPRPRQNKTETSSRSRSRAGSLYYPYTDMTSSLTYTQSDESKAGGEIMQGEQVNN